MNSNDILKAKGGESLSDWMPFFKSIFEASSNGMIVFDTNQKVYFANHQIRIKFKERFGQEIEIGNNIFSDKRFNAQLERTSMFYDLALKGESNDFEEELHDEVGIKIHLMSMRPIKNSKEEIIGALLVRKDVAPLENLLKKLEERQATLNAVLDATPDGIYALDNELKIIAINEQAKKEFLENGWKVEWNTNLYDIVENDKLKRWNEEYFDKVFRGESISYEGPIEMLEGGSRYVHNKYRPVYNRNKNIIACLELSRDETDKVEKEKTIKRQLEVLDLKNKELSKYIDSNLQLENFAYIASHDLKAPLRSVVSFAHLLKDKVYDSLEEKAKNYLDILIKSSENMQVLINDLLTYSRVKTEQIKLKEINLDGLFQRILLEVDVSVKEKNAKITLPKNLPSIIGDKSLLAQLFSNLIRNSLKFVAKDVQPKIKIDYAEDELFWNFKVIDNGIGISDENYEKIFGTFEKLHSNDIYEGTGLGLTICKGIVEKHHGRIYVDSKINEGTTFGFSIMKKIED